MKYYVVSDVHGFYTPLKTTLERAGFFSETKPHKLIICGDLLDRGSEAKKMEEFALKLLRDDKLIFIRGNHEDLFCDLLEEIEWNEQEKIEKISWHHIHNGTWDTFMQLCGFSENQKYLWGRNIAARIKNTPFWKRILPSAVNYFETERFVFVHGWFPYEFSTGENWRDAPEEEWRKSRWYNGMDLACGKNIILKNKTVVCGHLRTSYGHMKYEKIGSEYGSDADFSPFKAEGIIAIDGCTAHSGIVNCVIIED